MEKQLKNYRKAEQKVEDALSDLAMAKIALTDSFRVRRKAEGITVRKFALDTKMSAAFLSDLELGRRFPSEKNLQRIIDGLRKYPTPKQP